jgi:rod shape-determining protein MreD
MTPVTLSHRRRRRRRSAKHSNLSYLPIASVAMASLLTLLPIVTSSPLIPDFAFLVLISWRLLRPEMWKATIALPLGLFDDLVAGHPLGQSMALWTIAFLLFDFTDTRVVWRDYWMDWLFAGLAIGCYVAATWGIGRLMGDQAQILALLPQAGMSILAYPLVSRIVLTLDRLRLER